MTPQIVLSLTTSSLQQAPYSFLSPLSCKNGSKKAEVRPNLIAWHVSSWPFEGHSQIVNKLVNMSFRLDPAGQCFINTPSSWRFCRTEFLWNGYQTLFPPTQTQKKKKRWSGHARSIIHLLEHYKCWYYGTHGGIMRHHYQYSHYLKTNYGNCHAGKTPKIVLL